VTPCGSHENQRFGGTYYQYHQDEKKQLAYVFNLQVIANVVPRTLILFTVMLEAIRSSETSFLEALHGVTSKMTALFLVSAMKTSNLT
jgi:hypothetical protein